MNRYTAASAAAGNATPDGQLTGFGYAFGIAVDPATGEVFGADYSQPGGVLKFDNTGASVPFALDPLVAGQIANPGGIAVNPVDHHVFVGDLSISGSGSWTIYEVDSSGADTGNRYFAPSGATGIAIDASAQATIDDGSADVYAATGGNGVVKFTSPVSGYATFVTGNAGGVAVAPATQHVYVTGGNTAAEYDPAGVQVGPALGDGALGDSYGIGIDADGAHLYIADNTSNSAFAFTRGVVPNVTTGDATDIEAMTATLSGHVDPDGGPQVTCTFSYGTDPALAGADTVPCAGGPNATEADVTAQLGGLRPAQTYYYRLTASSSFATRSGEVKSFTTASAAPAAVTGAAVDLTTSHALLRGTLNPYGLQTSYHFDYGTTASYGSRVPAGSDSVAGAARVEREVARGVSGLQPATTYHYRLVATNSLGTTNGDDHTFTTDAAGLPVRGYEMVSPLDNAGIGVDDLFHGGVKARDDGNAIAYTLRRSTYPDAVANPAAPKVVSTRGGGGWSTLSLDAPTTNSGVVGALYNNVLATSADLSRTLVISSRSLGGQGVEGNGNLYVYDVPTKHYALVATSSNPTFYLQFASSVGRNKYIGGASDLSTFAFISPVPLTPDSTGDTPFYVWSETAGLQFVAPNGGNANDYQLPQAHQVSDDGSRVYVDDAGSGIRVPSLYEDGQLTPIAVDHQTGHPPTPEEGVFRGASRDGRYAVFFSRARLTDDSAGAVDGGALYRFDADTGEVKYLGAGPREGAFGRVLGGPAADGSVYFTSESVQAGATGSPFYLYRAGEEGVEFIAALHDPFDTPAYASPNGRYLAFEEGTRLTSYDHGGQGEIYLYDADTKELTCPSCRTDGGRATGAAHIGQQLASAGSEWQRYFAQSVTDDGQVFFDTPDPLVAGDVNGVRDVYAYQDGRVALISRGKVGREATFLDATPSGSDVFFATEDRLVGQDDNVTNDLYDARLGGGIAAQAPRDARVGCGGSECREPAGGSSGSPPTTSERIDAGSGGPGRRARARVSVVRTSFSPSALRLTVLVSGRGRIRVAGTGVSAASRTAARAGRYTLRVPLTERSRSARRAGRRVRVVVRVSLTPPFAAPGSLKLTRTLGR